MGFSTYLKEKRSEKNLSIRKLAEISNVSAMYISELERGKREKPSPEVLMKLSEGLEEPYENLMVVAGYIDPIDHMNLKNEKEDREWSLAEQKQRLDLLLDSNDSLFFQDRLLTKEEKAKLKSVIEIFLKD